MWLYFILLIVLCYVLTQKLVEKKKNLPPSPSLPSLPIIGHAYLIAKKPLYLSVAKLSNHYGPILYFKLFSRRVLLVSSPSLVEECLTKNDIVFANRPSQTIAGKYIGNNYTTTGWAPYSDHWRNLRKILSLELMSAYRVKMVSDIRAEEVRFMIRKLYNNYQGRTVDMRSLIFELTMNNIMRMVIGKRYYGDDVVEDDEVKEFRYLVEATFKAISGTYPEDYFPFFRLFSNAAKRLDALHNRRDKYIQKLIDEKRASIKGTTGDQKKKTMIEVLLSLQQKDPDYYNDAITKGILLNTLAAAIDTSSSTMERVMCFMINNPQVFKKAQNEMDNVVGYSRLVDDSDLAKLPYLQCIIKETLRISLPAPLLIGHYSSQECTVGGYRVPSGTTLLINAWAIQNDPKLWDEPEKFKPERFEATDGVQLGYKYLPFGLGRRGCPGEGLATHVMALVLGSFIQCFDWERVDKKSIDMPEDSGFLFPKDAPLHANCFPRSPITNLLSQI